MYVHTFSQVTAFTGKSVKINIWKFRLILAAFVTAVKFNEDLIYRNSHYARVGGVCLEEMNFLEACFLENIGYKIYVFYEQYISCCDYLLEMYQLDSLKTRACMNELSIQTKIRAKEKSDKSDKNERNLSKAIDSIKTVSSQLDLDKKRSKQWLYPLILCCKKCIF